MTFSSRRAAAALILILGAVFLGPAAAQAATVTVTVGADPTAEVGVPLRATGVADSESELDLRTIALPGGCDDAVGGTTRQLPPGAFDVSAAADIHTPGAYRVCATVAPYGGADAVTETTVSVRAPRTVVQSVRVARTVALGDPVRLFVRGSAEAPRYLTTILVPPGAGCAGARGAVEGLGSSDDIGAGPFARADGDRLLSFGRWTACVLVRHDAVTETPEQTLAFPVTVSRACTRATRDLRAARAYRHRQALAQARLDARATCRRTPRERLTSRP